MSGNKELDLVELRAEIEEYIEEVRARGPVKLSPARDRDEAHRWIAIYDPGVTGVGLPSHYPDIDHLIQGSRPAEICGKLVPASGSKCGGQILEADERMTFDAKLPDAESISRKFTEAELRESLDSAFERLANGEAHREMHEARKVTVPAVVFRTTEVKALKILDRWFGIGNESGSPYERRLALLGSPGMYAWVWCKARRDPQSDVGSVPAQP